ncbi:8071_t:CDS:2 [Diversispora eburnea]|uniref:8071_t:CDS:1 n=1 Tax=Diversispora eburnea TaxID=1213867 RepID=A0A9N8WI85_9GLOM|nr:8071_t:CDS:2 [Diversispora eburnea]
MWLWAKLVNGYDGRAALAKLIIKECVEKNIIISQTIVTRTNETDFFLEKYLREL